MQLGRSTKTDAVLDHIRTAPGIQDLDSDMTIVWRDARGKERTTTFKAFQNRVSERRRILFPQPRKKLKVPRIPVSG